MPARGVVSGVAGEPHGEGEGACGPGFTLCLGERVRTGSRLMLPWHGMQIGGDGAGRTTFRPWCTTLVKCKAQWGSEEAGRGDAGTGGQAATMHSHTQRLALRVGAGVRKGSGSVSRTRPQRLKNICVLAADEASAMRGLREQERQLRNRNTMLVRSDGGGWGKKGGTTFQQRGDGKGGIAYRVEAGWHKGLLPFKGTSKASGIQLAWLARMLSGGGAPYMFVNGQRLVYGCKCERPDGVCVKPAWPQMYV